MQIGQYVTETAPECSRVYSHLIDTQMAIEEVSLLLLRRWLLNQKHSIIKIKRLETRNGIRQSVVSVRIGRFIENLSRSRRSHEAN